MAVKSPVVAQDSVMRSPSVVGPTELHGIRIIDIHEEGCDTHLVMLKKETGKQLGMGIGMRQRGVLVTSLQPNTQAAEKLKVCFYISCCC